jgi:hypothetical protein
MVIAKNNVQGDIWSKGLSKFNETYFFFRIANPLQFTKDLKKLVSKTGDAALISTLAMAETGQDQVAQAHAAQIKAKNENKIIPPDAALSGALIAFTKTGLEAVSTSTGVSPIIVHIARFKKFCQTQILYP